MLSSRAFVNVDDDNDDDDNEDDDDNDNDDDDDDHVDSNSGFDGDFKFPKFLEKKVMKAKNVAPDLEGRGVRKQVNLFTMYPNFGRISTKQHPLDSENRFRHWKKSSMKQFSWLFFNSLAIFCEGPVEEILVKEG